MIQTMTPGTIRNIREGKNYYSYPGCEVTNLYEHISEGLVNCICRLFAVTPMELFDHNRKAERVFARHMLRYILHGRGWGWSEIAVYMGCTHASVIHSCKEADNLISTDKDYAEKYNYIQKKIERDMILFPDRAIRIIKTWPSRKVKSIDDEGIVRVYGSCKQAALAHNLCEWTLRRCLQGRKSKVDGKKWFYVK